MKSFAEWLPSTVLKRFVERVLERIFDRRAEAPTPEGSRPPPTEQKKSHPWRLCPLGHHWVVEHLMMVPASSVGPERTTRRRGHCRVNPSGKEMYSSDELREIAIRNFGSLKDDPKSMPSSHDLGFDGGNSLDLSIAGWCKFWNEVFSGERPITPNFVKALLATETGFRRHADTPSNGGPARGPLQITEQTRRILQDRRGELRDHYIEISETESREVEPNLGAGVRWLFHKRYLIEKRLGRKVSTEELAAEYKGIFSQVKSGDVKSSRIMQSFSEYLEVLEGHNP